MDAKILVYIILGIVSFDFIFGLTLDLLNIKSNTNTLPKELEGICTQDKLDDAQGYFMTNAKFDLLSSIFSFVLILFALLFDFFAYIDAFWLYPTFGYPEFVRSLAFFMSLFIISDLLQLPFSIYKTFVIEEKFGFNKMTMKLFVFDKMKGYLLTFILGGGILTLFLWIVSQLQTNFWWVFWVIISVIILFVNIFYTVLFLPLFNKLTPLEDGELKDKITAYAQSVNFPLSNIYVMDGSKRSSKANAFFSGIGKSKKIVLFDTLIQDQTVDEIVAVIAHEAGHYKKNHIIQSLIASIVQMGVILYILSLFIFNSNISHALGGDDAIHLNLIGFALLISPISHLTSLIFNIWSRKNEYEADDYAKTTFNSTSLISALKKLSISNLSNFNPHPLYVFFHYSHPPLKERIKALLK